MRNLFQNDTFSPIFEFETSKYASAFEIYYDVNRTLNPPACWSIPIAKNHFNELKDQLQSLNIRERAKIVVTTVLDTFSPQQVTFDNSFDSLDIKESLIDFLMLEFYAYTQVQQDGSASKTRLSFLKSLNMPLLTKKNKLLAESRFTSELYNQKRKAGRLKYKDKITASEQVYQNFVTDGSLNNPNIHSLIDYQIANAFLTTPVINNPFVAEVRNCNCKFLKHFRLMEFNHLQQEPIIALLLEYVAERMSCANLFIKLSNIALPGPETSSAEKDYLQLLANILAMHPLVSYRLKLLNLISPSDLDADSKLTLAKYRSSTWENSFHIYKEENASQPPCSVEFPLISLVKIILQQIVVIIPLCSYLLKLYELISPHPMQPPVIKQDIKNTSHTVLHLFDKDGLPITKENSNGSANTIINFDQCFSYYAKSITQTNQSDIISKLISDETKTEISPGEDNGLLPSLLSATLPGFEQKSPTLSNNHQLDELNICQLLWGIDDFYNISPYYKIDLFTRSSPKPPLVNNIMV